jgi:hypothetical protein
MTTRKKVTKKKDILKTAHYRTMLIPKVRKLVSVLRQVWPAMGLLERGKRLSELTAFGCSARGLERELKRSATSIRRHIAIAGLPEEDRQAIDAGASAKKILEQKASDERHRLQAERVIKDRKTGALSDEVAGIILDFCRAKGGPRRIPVYGEDAEKLFNQTRTYLYVFDRSGYRTVTVSRKNGVKELFNRTRPAHEKDAFWISYQAAWLANVVRAIAPERPIWESALDKAENRVSELTPKRNPPIEIYQDPILRWATLSASPARRAPYTGAWSLGRQGGAAASVKPK